MRAFLVASCLIVIAFAAGCTGPAPQDLVCTSDASGNHLAWSPLPNATSYLVWRQETAASNDTPPAPVGETADTHFTDTNVTRGVSYTYYVTGANETGITEPAVCEVTSVPTFPTALSWTLAVVGAGAVVGLIAWRRR